MSMPKHTLFVMPSTSIVNLLEIIWDEHFLKNRETIIPIVEHNIPGLILLYDNDTQ
jgi:hypothetical protein